LPQMDVSIVMPVLNGAATIGPQLDALYAQRTERSWEFVLADNGCTDDTVELASRHPISARMKVVNASRRTSINVARNEGTRQAIGAYICYCDADDVVSSTWIDGHAASLDHAALTTGPLDYDLLNPPTVRRPPPSVTEPMLGLGWKPFAYGANLGVRRSVFDAVGGFDERFILGGDDVDFSWRILLAGYELGFAADALVHYRLKARFRDVCRQARRYAYGDSLLYRTYHPNGVERRSTSQAARSWLRLLTRDLRLLRTLQGRSVWAWNLGTNFGRLWGSATNRTWYP
jgi:glycosyltransferase involved in cell wall biosynthesis